MCWIISSKEGDAFIIKPSLGLGLEWPYKQILIQIIALKHNAYMKILMGIKKSIKFEEAATGLREHL